MIFSYISLYFPPRKCYYISVMGVKLKTKNRRPAGATNASAPMTSRASGAVCEKAYGQEDAMVASGIFEGAEVISVYTRAQAIEDGVLADVTEVAREAGFNCSVAVTSAVWDAIEDIPPSKTFQDVKGRLWDVLWMARLAAKRGGDLTFYKIIMHRGRKTYQTLKMVAGPDDAGALCITIMMPDED